MRHVYFIRPIGMQGPIKIGCSISPDGRRETLRHWSPFPLEIMAEIEGGYGIERRFHAQFQHLFVSHEWFTVAPDLLATIELVKAGTFDVETLPPPKVLHNTPQGERKPWSAEAKRASSYTHRCRWKREKSGWYFGGRESLGGSDPAVAAQVEAYLAAPHIHGTPCHSGAERRAAWLATLSTQAGEMR